MAAPPDGANIASQTSICSGMSKYRPLNEAIVSSVIRCSQSRARLRTLDGVLGVDVEPGLRLRRGDPAVEPAAQAFIRAVMRPRSPSPTRRSRRGPGRFRCRPGPCVRSGRPDRVGARWPQRRTSRGATRSSAYAWVAPAAPRASRRVSRCRRPRSLRRSRRTTQRSSSPGRLPTRGDGGDLGGAEDLAAGRDDTPFDPRGVPGPQWSRAAGTASRRVATVTQSASFAVGRSVNACLGYCTGLPMTLQSRRFSPESCSRTRVDSRSRRCAAASRSAASVGCTASSSASQARASAARPSAAAGV